MQGRLPLSAMFKRLMTVVLLAASANVLAGEQDITMLFVGDLMLDEVPGEVIRKGGNPFASFDALFRQAEAWELSSQFADLPMKIIQEDKDGKAGVKACYQVYNAYQRLLATWSRPGRDRVATIRACRCGRDWRSRNTGRTLRASAMPFSTAL